MKIVFAGTTQHAASVLRHLAQSFHQVVAVLTREDAPVGRKAVLTASPVAELAASLGIPLIKSNRIDAKVTAEIQSYQPELGVVIAYGGLLKRATLDIPRHGWLNLHYSLLPNWRGAAPVQHALLNGDTITGVTIFRLDEGMDTGDILSSVQTQIQPRENTEDLLDRLTQLGITLLDESLAKIEANIATFTAQVGTSSLAGKISRQDAVIDWRKNCLVIERLIRAMNPEPIAWTNFGSDSLRIFDAQSTSMRSDLKPGEVFSINGKAYVSCGENSVLEILEVQPAGKNRMRATDWLRGLNQNVVLGG